MPMNKSSSTKSTIWEFSEIRIEKWKQKHSFIPIEKDHEWKDHDAQEGGGELGFSKN
jgi:hypothetical protein